MTDRARKKREVSLSGYFTDEEEEGFPEDELAETLFGVPQTPEEEYLKTLLWEELGQALSELPPPQRRCLKRPSFTATALKCWQRRRGQRTGAVIPQAQGGAVSAHAVAGYL